MSIPAWVYDLISAVELYENVHGPHDENWPCLGKALDAVPERERDCARAIVTWRQESGWLPPSAQRPEAAWPDLTCKTCGVATLEDFAEYIGMPRTCRACYERRVTGVKAADAAADDA